MICGDRDRIDRVIDGEETTNRFVTCYIIFVNVV